MAAVAIALVRREQHGPAIGRERHVLHFEIAFRERRNRAGGGRNRIEVKPAIALPREDDAIAGGPKQLIVRCHAAEHAAGAWLRAPYAVAHAGLHRGHADRPGLARTAGLSHRAQPTRWLADEDDAAPIGRPFRIAVEIGARVEIA